ncbi:hypothetical protein TKK_0015938 [Trichogramma kaykai]|uniref:RING-type domain-containing protein n=1 Tax=Trichogramma kaykai TaxID=54128 RepID=A0ABD2W9R4_9HYME
MDSPYDYSVSSYVLTSSELADTEETEDDEFPDEDFREAYGDVEFDEVSDADAVTDNDFDSELMNSSASVDENFESSYSTSENDSSDYSTVILTDSDTTVNEESNEPVSKRIKLDQGDSETLEESEVDAHQKCPICLAAWTNVGDHRLCSLRCGHLFGLKCIKQWLQSRNNVTAKKCPQCNSKASFKHIRYIYANKITCLDNTEIEKMKKKVEEANLRVSMLSKALSKQKKKTKKYKKMYKSKALAILDSDFCSSD